MKLSNTVVNLPFARPFSKTLSGVERLKLSANRYQMTENCSCFHEDFPLQDEPE